MQARWGGGGADPRRQRGLVSRIRHQRGRPEGAKGAAPRRAAPAAGRGGTAARLAAVSLAVAAIVLALDLAAGPAPERTDGFDDIPPLAPQPVPAAFPIGWPGAPHPGLLPAAHASHSGPEKCNNYLVRGITLQFITPDGTYGINETIDISVAPANTAHKITGTSEHHWIPTTILVMETGAVDRNAVYAGFTPPGSLQSSLDSIIYRYTVQENDFSDDLDYINSRDSLWWGDPTNGFLDNMLVGGHPANCWLANPGNPGSLSAGANIMIDGIRPLLHNVTAVTANGTYGAGKHLIFNASFSEPVFVYQGREPKLALNFSGTPRNATYASGNESRSLAFEYTVQAGDDTARLDYNATSALLGAVPDFAGNDMNRMAVAAPGEPGSLGRTSKIATETVRPGVASVSSLSPDRAYRLGETIRINVTFTEPVIVNTTDGRPALPLNTTGGATGGAAEYHSGSGSASLEFRYTVEMGHESGNLDQGPTDLSLNGGSIKDMLGNAAELGLSGLAGADTLAVSSSLAVDGKIPSVAGVSSPNGTGPHGIDDALHVEVYFDEAVTVAGTPAIRLETGAADSDAPYHGGSGTQTLVFRYQVGEGDLADDLDYKGAAPFALGDGASIRDGAGNDADLDLSGLPAGMTLAGSSDVEVDGKMPAVAGVSSPNGTGPHGIDDALHVEVYFDEAVTVAGTPAIRLETGAAGSDAPYHGGSGAQTLVFRYQVGEGDLADDLDYKGAAPFALGDGASIRDGAGNDADLDLSGLPAGMTLAGSSGVEVDGVRPGAVSVSSPSAAGTYGAGEKIGIDVAFSEAVAYAGDPPSLALDAGGDAPGVAPYRSGNGTATLSFEYEVRAGDRTGDLSYSGAGALSGAGIADLAGNRANLTLPAPGSDGSLSGSSSISLLGLAGPFAATAGASFTGPNTVRIEYDWPLGPPANHTGPVYGAINAEGDDDDRNPLPGGESGLGTSVHTVRFGGDGVGRGQAGSIALNADLEWTAGGARYNFTADSVPVQAGENALAPRGRSPVVPIEADGFVRAINSTGAGDAARPAVNVTGLAAIPDSYGHVAIITSFAEVSFPPGATPAPSPAGGLLKLYLAPRGPSAADVAGAFGVAASAGVAVLPVVEVGGGDTRIAFDLPVRIRLVGQADGSAFYVDAAGAVVPIDAVCAADNTTAVHAQLGGSGECHTDSAAGADKIVYTYHLTPFGTARGPDGGPVVADCRIALGPGEVGFGNVQPGGRSGTAGQAVTSTGTMPLAAVTISAGNWTGADGIAPAMPASATSVMSAAGEWTPLGGEVAIAVQEDGTQAQFRLDVPQGAAAGGASQVVTYTASCRAPPPAG